MELDCNQRVFFALVKAGLWEREVRLSSFENINFEEVLSLAEKQTVTGLVAAGVEHVVGTKIPQDFLLQFVGSALQIEQQNKAMDYYIEYLIQSLRDNGIYTLLMKGQGIAQCYERPHWRTSGDIDLLLSHENYVAAKNYLIPRATDIDVEQSKKKHLALTIDNWVIELHGSLRTNLWGSLERLLDDVQDEVFYSGRVRSWLNGRTQVFLLRPDEDVVFVFAHILQHFFVEGIGLRQICDWCRLLYTYKDSIDTKLLEQRLRSASLIKEWRVFAAFAVEYLGMPTEAMPFYAPAGCWKKKANGVLALIMDSGNFGQGKDKSYKENHSQLASYCISFGRHAKDGFRRFQLFPREAILMWWKLMVHGLKGLLHISKNIEEL